MNRTTNAITLGARPSPPTKKTKDTVNVNAYVKIGIVIFSVKCASRA
jgi:hypothetical protein